MRGTIAVSGTLPISLLVHEVQYRVGNFRVVASPWWSCAVKGPRGTGKKSAKLEQVLQVTCLFSVAKMTLSHAQGGKYSIRAYAPKHQLYTAPIWHDILTINKKKGGAGGFSCSL